MIIKSPYYTLVIIEVKKNRGGNLSLFKILYPKILIDFEGATSSFRIVK